MLDESENKQFNLVKEIEFNRSKKGEEYTQKADYLFSQLQKEKVKYEKILSRL